MIICHRDSNRQVRALARNVLEDKCREAGAEVLSIEGEEAGEWVLVDLGDLIVVHVMQADGAPVLQPRGTVAGRRRRSGARQCEPAAAK
jgi:hypothetical protein